MNKNDDKKTILKLLNKYAESYKVLQQENTDLKSEIIDLKANLRINKEIIQDFFKKNNLTLSPSDTESFYIKKLNEENKILAEQLDKILQEKDELRNKLTYIEQTVFESINKEREETEKMRNNIFIMDNALIKKDNIIFALKKKIAKLTENDKTEYDKETFVIDPSSSVNAIHDELLLYKQIYETLTKHIKDMKRSIDNYEKMVENSKLKFDLKAASQQNQLVNNANNYHSHNPSNNNNNNTNNKYSQRLYYNNNKEDQLNETIVRDKAQKIVSVTEMSSNTNSVRRIIHNNNKNTNNNNFNNNRNLTDFDRRKEDLNDGRNCNSENVYYNNNGNRLQNNQYSEENDNYLEFEREKRNILEGKVNNETEDWTDLLKQSNMTREEFNYYSKNRGLIKIIDLIENLNKLLRDKNFQIRILLEENKNLNWKNEELNKENVTLNQQNMLLLKESIKNSTITDQNKNTKGDTGMDSSMINNTSRNTGIHHLSSNNGKIFSILNNTNKAKSNHLAKNYYSENVRKNMPEIIPTLESVTSSEFRNGINVNESGFISNANDENDVIQMKNIDINQD